MAENKDLASSSSKALGASDDGFHHAQRGEAAGDISGTESIQGYDATQMQARTALTAEEEKRLLRRIDWHLMPVCSIIFMFKNLDSDNVRLSCLPTSKWQMRPSFYTNPRLQISNARIMNRGTPANIMTQLGMTSDEYALLTIFYYVRVGL